MLDSTGLVQAAYAVSQDSEVRAKSSYLLLQEVLGLIQCLIMSQKKEPESAGCWF